MAVKSFIEPLMAKRPTLKPGQKSKISIDIYMNETFANEIYLPLRNEMDKL